MFNFCVIKNNFMRMFKTKLRKIIEESGMTQEEFAKATKVGRTTLYNYMNGRKPTMNFIINLVEYDPDIDLNWLLKEHKYKRNEIVSVVREEKSRNKNEYIEKIERALDALKKLSD